MKRFTRPWFGLFLIFLLACCGQTAENIDPASSQPQPQAQVKGKQQSTMPQPRGQQFQYAPAEVLVKFRPETDAKTIVNIQTDLKLKTIHIFSSPNLFLMKITDGAAVETTIKRLSEFVARKWF